MDKNLFCVYDNAAGLHMDPFVAPTIEYAIREFKRIANDPNSNINQYAEDYTLFHIGSFDPRNGTLTPFELRSLGVAIHFKEQLSFTLNSDKE